VNPSNFRNPLRDHAIVAFAGPAGGFVVALIVLLLYVALFPLLGRAGAAADLFQLLFIMTYLTAIVYSVFNLVPIPPLDGGNILYYFGNNTLRGLMDKIRPFGFFIIIVVFWIFDGGVLIRPIISAMIEPFTKLPAMVWG
jgi:Zn-dependent protease